jgi:hypothetical protein
MQHDERDDVLVYKGQKRTIRTRVLRCTGCGATAVTGQTLAARERAFDAFRAEVDGGAEPTPTTKGMVSGHDL